MKTINEIHKQIKDPLMRNLTMNTLTHGVRLIIRNNFRKLMYLTGFTGIGLLMNACVPGYVVAEPTYTESVRPPQPSNVHVWINGDWVWSRQTHVYVRNNGYWDQPRNGRVYIQGEWQTNQKGKYWKKGHYRRY
jgi:hypothetical protein